MFLPFKIIQRCLCVNDKEEPEEANEITVVITEPKDRDESAEPKDEILLIHGFPDSGEMWDK